MIDYKKFRQITLTREVGTIFEKHKLTNGDVIEFLTLYLVLMKEFAEGL